MENLKHKDLLDAGVHFGHLTRKWDPRMAPYIFMEKNGIHIIDLKKTQKLLQEAADAVAKLTAGGKTVLFVGTKKQAKNVIETEAKRCGSNWVSERWLGGMLTNFATIRKSVKRLHNLEKQETDGTFDQITKKERLHRTRERDKLKKILEGVETMNKLPGALFIVDIKKEDIAVKEAKRLRIPVFAIVDTNCEPDNIDYIIPANDDAVKTIELITKTIADAILEGQAKLKEKKANEAAEKERLKKEREKEKEEERKKTGKSETEKHESEKKMKKKTVKKKTANVKAREEKEIVKEEVEKPETTKEKPEKEKVNENKMKKVDKEVNEELDSGKKEEESDSSKSE